MKLVKPFLFYLALALIFTWPLVTHLQTHLIGTGWDGPAQAWNFWWFKYSLINLRQSPLYTNFIFYPLGVSLVTHAADYLNEALFLPLQLVLGINIAVNLSIIISLALQGFFTFLLAKKLTNDLGASLVAGVIFGFSPFNFAHLISGHYTWGSGWIIPASFLSLIKLRQKPNPRSAIIVGLCLAASFYGNYIWASYLFVVFALFFIWELKDRRLLWHRALYLYLLAGLISLASATPLIWPSLGALRQGEFIKVDLLSTTHASVSPLLYLLPSQMHPSWGRWISRFKPPSAEQIVSLGSGTLALAICELISRKNAPKEEKADRRLFSLLAWLFLVLSLGPRLRIRGQDVFTWGKRSFSFWLPFTILHKIPALGMSKEPARMAIIVSLCAAVLASYGLAYLSRLSSKRAPFLTGRFLVALFLTLAIFELFPRPLPLISTEAPQIYQEIAKDEGDYAILNLPLGWFSSMQYLGNYSFMTQYYQTTHHKKVLEGFASQVPKEKFEFYDHLPVVRYLYNPIENAPNENENGRRQALEELYQLEIRYIVVNKKEGDNLKLTNIYRSYLEDSLGLRPFKEDGEVVAYRL